jgi:hypothetical protein
MTKPKVGDKVRFLKQWPPGQSTEAPYIPYLINEEVTLINLDSWTFDDDKAYVPVKNRKVPDGWSARFLITHGYCKLLGQRKQKLKLP